MTTARTRSARMLMLALCAVPLLAAARVDPALPLQATAPAAAAPGLLRQAGPMLAGTSRGTMRVGLTIVAPPQAADDATIPLDPATASAHVRCDSPGLGYRECALPFRGPARLSHEVSEVMCVEGGNWGHRDGVVWVDRGCSGVFVSAKPTPARTTAGL